MPGEPLWLSSDRDVVEAWHVWTDLLCSGCGQPRDEAWTRDEDYRWKGELRQCRPCEAIEKARDEHVRSGTKDSAPEMFGMKVVADRSEEQMKPGKRTG